MVLIIGSNLNDTINPFFNSSGPLLPTAFSDIINGGLGADTMDGGNGDDIYIVDNIGDVVRESFDTIAGGIDTVQSSVSYSLSPGTVVGTQGFAIENLTLTGTANINATGNAKSNKLLGNNGGNIFFGTAGNDTIDGGLGNDTANYSALTSVVTLGAFGVVTKGSLGTDTLVKVETIVGSNLLGDTVDHSGASVAPATGTITNLTTGAVTVNGTTSPLPLSFTVSQFENVIGSGFNDSITGDAGNNLLAGGSGNDTLNGGAGNDRIFGDVSLAFSSPVFSFNNKFYTLTTAASWTQAQAQAVALGGNLVTVNDAAENQFLVNTFGGTERLWLGLTDEVTEGTFRWANGEAVTYTNWSVGQPDNFNNEDYAEFNLGGAGKWNDLPNAALSLRGIVEIGNSNDLIFGGAGNDTINGGVGLDVVDYSALGSTVSLGAFGVVNKGTLGTDSLIAVESIIGSSLLGDTVDHSGATVAPATGTITNLTTGAVTVSGTAFPLPLSFTVSQFEHVIGSGFADSITGNAANNSLNGGGGNDTIFGLAGNDTLNGEGGNDTLDGGTGNDLLNGGVGDDSLNGGDNNDTLIGSVGFDTINGGLGIDTATYSTLTNVVTLGAFGILSKGALGVDSLIGVESIVGSSLLGDTVDHSGASAAPATGTITNLTTGTVTVTGTAAPLPLTFSVSQFENVIGSGFADSITGNTANNSLSGGGGNDTISGLAGSDTLDGGAGNDSLDGGIGNDTLLGGSGNDTLIGGLGNDVLTGGLGNDRFRFLTLAERIDTITDFSRGFLIAPVDTLAATTTIIGPVFPLTNRDLVEVSASGFGATSLAQFSYNSTTGSLSFLGTQFATIQNLPSGFAVASDVVLI